MTTSFQVMGCEDAKSELRDIVDFLTYPEKYSALGGRLPKGVLLTGPPGTGNNILYSSCSSYEKDPVQILVSFRRKNAAGSRRRWGSRCPFLPRIRIRVRRGLGRPGSTQGQRPIQSKRWIC